jgi:hypothetical protein
LADWPRDDLTAKDPAAVGKEGSDAVAAGGQARTAAIDAVQSVG